jgi:large subunit ribosomal protein L22
MSEKDPKSRTTQQPPDEASLDGEQAAMLSEATEPEAEATEPVEPAPADEHEPGAAAEAAEKAHGGDAAAEDAPAAEEEAPKPKRTRRKKAEPVVEEATEPEAEEAAEPEAEEAAEPEAEAEAAEEAKPKRTRRRKAAEPEAEEEEAEEVAPPAPKPEPKRKPLGVDGGPVLVRAQARYVRSSARKARLVSDQIRGKSVHDARAILATTPRAVARDWTKLLESAIANAENNHELVGDDLRIARIHADEGPTLKRFRPRAMGRATKIRKRTSHLTILLSPKE